MYNEIIVFLVYTHALTMQRRITLLSPPFPLACSGRLTSSVPLGAYASELIYRAVNSCLQVLCFDLDPLLVNSTNLWLVAYSTHRAGPIYPNSGLHVEMAETTYSSLVFFVNGSKVFHSPVTVCRHEYWYCIIHIKRNEYSSSFIASVRQDTCMYVLWHF